MNPGRELDALIAVGLFGWMWLKHRKEPGGVHFRSLFIPGHEVKPFSGSYVPSLGGEPIDACNCPAYSTDIAAAFLVVDLIESQGYWMRLQGRFYPGQPYFAGFTQHDFTGWNGRPDNQQPGESPAHAICLSALRWKESVESEPSK